MREVKVNVTELLGVVKKNFAQHMADYAEAFETNNVYSGVKDKWQGK